MILLPSARRMPPMWLAPVLALLVCRLSMFGQESPSKQAVAPKPCVMTPAEKEEIKKKIAGLLKEAESKYENAVAEAFHDLAQLGCKLDQADVDRIAALMRNAPEVVNSDCTGSVYRKMDKWAAGALIKIQSTFVTEELRAEARKVPKGGTTRSVRVTG